MTTEQISSESIPSKRQRRIKRDPQFIFDNPVGESTVSIQSNDEQSTSPILYQPGDVVWSKLGSFPWWPALIYRWDADRQPYTKTLKIHNKIQRQYFIYFYGKYLEYAWLPTNSLLKYAGLDNFIQNAESAVQQASTKVEQVKLANRYQLKVSVKKRQQWDQAIELADQALKLSKEQRLEEFDQLLKDAPKRKNKKSKINVVGIRRKYPDIPEEKSSASLDEPSTKKKRGRKPKSQTELINSDSEIEYEYKPTVIPPPPPPLNLPPLSNFELKQIVEGLLNHPQDQTLSFDQAQAFATEKAIEIVFENHQYRMSDISSEWFYDGILLKYPSVIFKYHSWFDHIDPSIIPDGNNPIELKQWQIALMIQAKESV